MYIILVYDMGEKRVGKMLKLCRRYLHWVQNSVFEGEISPVKLKELKLEAKAFMEEDEDSILIFKSRQEKWARQGGDRGGERGDRQLPLVVEEAGRPKVQGSPLPFHWPKAPS